MNQKLVVCVEKELNGFTYSFSMPVGAQWVDAITVAQEMGQAVIQIAELEKKQRENQKENKPEQAVDLDYDPTNAALME